MKPYYRMETVTENQIVERIKKLKNKFPDFTIGAPTSICPIRDVLSTASDKWSILIILFLGYSKVLRFGELKKYVSQISSKVLSERLKKLERDGYITKKIFAEVPIRVEYQLTSLGYKYLEKLIVLSEWVTEEMDTIVENRKKYDKK
jgi:DNA-binding HxlR family transcriptional regulator